MSWASHLTGSWMGHATLTPISFFAAMVPSVCMEYELRKHTIVFCSSSHAAHHQNYTRMIETNKVEIHPSFMIPLRSAEIPVRSTRSVYVCVYLLIKARSHLIASPMYRWTLTYNGSHCPSHDGSIDSRGRRDRARAGSIGLFV